MEQINVLYPIKFELDFINTIERVAFNLKYLSIVRRSCESDSDSDSEEQLLHTSHGEYP